MKNNDIIETVNPEIVRELIKIDSFMTKKNFKEGYVCFIAGFRLCLTSDSVLLILKQYRELIEKNLYDAGIDIEELINGEQGNVK